MYSVQYASDRTWPSRHRKLAKVVQRVNYLINRGETEIAISVEGEGKTVSITDLRGATVTLSMLKEKGL